MLTLQLLVESGRAPHEAIGFHAQQACEKFLKTVAVLHGIVFERTHDLIVLHELLTRHGINIPVPKDTLRALNSYAVQFRYEGCPIEMVKNADCLHQAKLLADWTKLILQAPSE